VGGGGGARLHVGACLTVALGQCCRWQMHPFTLAPALTHPLILSTHQLILGSRVQPTISHSAVFLLGCRSLTAAARKGSTVWLLLLLLLPPPAPSASPPPPFSSRAASGGLNMATWKACHWWSSCPESECLCTVLLRLLPAGGSKDSSSSSSPSNAPLDMPDSCACRGCWAPADATRHGSPDGILGVDRALDTLGRLAARCLDIAAAANSRWMPSNGRLAPRCQWAVPARRGLAFSGAYMRW
jgi:hypothetical protein